VKLSVSLSDDDVAVIDDYARETGLPSRSAVVQHAVRLLRQRGLEAEYEAAFDEWHDSQDRPLWETTIADGLDRAAG
jgi:Arc/MetJ-type ribon-helix-helix transcriptional regulator